MPVQGYQHDYPQPSLYACVCRYVSVHVIDQWGADVKVVTLTDPPEWYGGSVDSITLSSLPSSSTPPPQSLSFSRERRG